MSPAVALLALFFLSKKPSTPTAGASPGVRVVGQVIQIPLRDGTNAIVAKLTDVAGVLDAIVIARGTVYGSQRGQAAVLRCGSARDAEAIAEEIRGKF